MSLLNDKERSPEKGTEAGEPGAIDSLERRLRTTRSRFENIGLEEKVERLRGIVKVQNDQIARLQEANFSMERLIRNHDHNKHNGEVVVPAMIYPGRDVHTKPGFDEGYI